MKHSRSHLVLWLFFSMASGNLLAQQEQGKYNCAPNTLPINSRICIGVTETPAYMYKDFLAWVGKNKGMNSSDFKTAQPDYSKWRDVFPKLSAQKIQERFLDTDQLALMPIIGITREQAMAYCEWKTETFKAQLAEMNKEERAQFPEEFEFRLPTANEWGRMRFLIQDKAMKKQIKKLAAANSKAFKLSRSKLLQDKKITNIYANMDEKLGFYNLFNNVSELTSTTGESVGGSWNKPNEEDNFKKIFAYSEAEAWLGFRIIFEIIK